MADVKAKDTSTKVSIDEASEHVSSLTFDDKVIKKMAGMAATEIPGILAMSGNFISGLTDKILNADDPTKGITVAVGKKQVAIDMKVVCEYGRNIPEIFQAIVDKVSGVIKEMTGLDVVEVNVHVYDVLTKEDFSRQMKGKPEERPELNKEESPEAPPTVE